MPAKNDCARWVAVKSIWKRRSTTSRRCGSIASSVTRSCAPSRVLFQPCARRLPDGQAVVGVPRAKIGAFPGLCSSTMAASRPKTPPPTLRVAVDTGGTFTDCVWLERGRLRIAKVFSTPGDPSLAIADALAQANPTGAIILLHGTTVGTNTLLQRKGSSRCLRHYRRLRRHHRDRPPEPAPAL